MNLNTYMVVLDHHRFKDEELDRMVAQFPDVLVKRLIVIELLKDMLNGPADQNQIKQEKEEISLVHLKEE